MHPEEEEEVLPTISKWPFYLGDALLVGLAVTIALLGDWQLGGVQVFACVLAVALGAALLTLPFVTEFLMFAREEKEDRLIELQLLKKQLESFESTMRKQNARLKEIESSSGLDDQRYELLASAIDQKVQAEHPDLTDLIKRVEAIETSKAKTTKTAATVEKELASISDSIAQSTKSLDALQARVSVLEATEEKRPTKTSVNETGKMKDEATPPEKSRKKKETGLLKRAIQEKQDTASTSVSRIIDPENKSAVSDSEAKPADTLENEVISSEIEQLPDDFSVSLGADLMMDDDLLDFEADSNPEKTTASKKKKVKAPARQLITTTVAVNKLMGIGNKPFLRGSSSGLSWKKGIEMEFQEIGKWIWSVEMPENETVELQVYRNDEDADRKGKFTLTSGQKLEIEPEF